MHLDAVVTYSLVVFIHMLIVSYKFVRPNNSTPKDAYIWCGFK